MIRAPRLTAQALLLPFTLALSLVSQDGYGKGPAADSDASGAPKPSTLTWLASRAQSFPLGRPAFVAVSQVQETSLPSEAASALFSRIDQTVASSLPMVGKRAQGPLSKSDARQRARRAGLPLVYLSVTLSSERLTINAELIEFAPRFWLRSIKPEGTVVQKESWSEVVDGEIRALLPRPKALLAEQKVSANPLLDTLALACGHYQSKTELDVVVVGRRSIALLKEKDGALSSVLKKDWDSLSPISPTPLRAPLAAARLVGPVLVVGSSDRRDLLRFSYPFQVVEQTRSAYPLNLVDCAPFVAGGLSITPTRCFATKRQTESFERLRSPALDATETLRAIQADGTPQEAKLELQGAGLLNVALTSPGAAPRSETLQDVGSQLATADLDGDGVLEVIHSSAAALGAPDELKVISLTSPPTLRASKKLPSIQAIAVCPFDGENPQALVVAAGGKLTVFR